MPGNGNPPTSSTNEELSDLILQRILAELSSYNNPSQLDANAVPTPPIPSSSITPQVISHVQAPERPPQHQPRASVPAAPVQSQDTVVNPATIFDWPQALRCVNKMAASDPQFGPTLKSLMADQERNVRDWEQKRTEKLEEQRGRAEKIRNLNKILKSVGAEPQAEPTEAELEQELGGFHRSIYKALQQMSKAHTQQLKTLGVPFFGVNPDFVVTNSIQQTAATRNPMSQARITEAELLELQRKMIQYLEDLYKD